MNKKCPLVSIITPCYNSEKYIGRMMDSILDQTYSNIELICVDDGSTDLTVEKIGEYKEKFENKKYRLTCITAEHKGQAAAVNAGLKFVEGEYIGVLDSDDFLINTSIEKRVNILETHRDYAIVASDYYIVNETDLGTVIGRGNDFVGDLAFQPNQFTLTIIGFSLVTPVGYLIRVSDMKKINPNMEINECVEGQNYQILLPLYYFYKRYYIDEPLAFYVIRKDSHAHSYRSRSQILERNKNLNNMLYDILRSLGMRESEIIKYQRMSIFSKLIGDA